MFVTNSLLSNLIRHTHPEQAYDISHTHRRALLCKVGPLLAPLEVLSDAQLQQMSTFLDILLETNKNINLTGMVQLCTLPRHNHITQLCVPRTKHGTATPQTHSLCYPSLNKPLQTPA